MSYYIEVPQFNAKNSGSNCAMCVGEHRNCDDLPPCRGTIFIRPADLPEYHVRFIADRLENP